MSEVLSALQKASVGSSTCDTFGVGGLRIDPLVVLMIGRDDEHLDSSRTTSIVHTVEGAAVFSPISPQPPTPTTARTGSPKRSETARINRLANRALPCHSPAIAICAGKLLMIGFQ